MSKIKDYEKMYMSLNESIMEVFEKTKAQRHNGTEQDRLDRETVFFTIADIYENFNKKIQEIIK